MGDTHGNGTVTTSKSTNLNFRYNFAVSQTDLADSVEGYWIKGQRNFLIVDRLPPFDGWMASIYLVTMWTPWVWLRHIGEYQEIGGQYHPHPSALKWANINLRPSAVGLYCHFRASGFWVVLPPNLLVFPYTSSPDSWYSIIITR